MIKSGLIFGAGMFLMVLLFSSVASPFCALCIAVVMGMGSGYVAGWFDKPATSAEATRKGAISGAITGVCSVLAQMIAAVILSVLYQTNQSYFVSMCPGGSLPDVGTFWVAQMGIGACLALVNIGITAGLGIAGSAIWFSTSGKKSGPNLPPPSPV